MQINATSPIKMPPPYGGVPPIICKKPIDSNGHEEVTIQLCGVIEATSQFLEVFDILGRAKSGDEIRIVIDTPGGNVYATQLLVDYMMRCKANVTTVASGLVASAGTIVWFYGKNREVGPWAKFMFHGTSHGAFGRSSEIKEEATELVKFMESLLKDMVAAGILTNEEYTKITSCKQDTYITGEQMRRRLFAAMSSTEALHILSEEGGAGEGEGSGSGKGSGSGEGSGNDDGKGSGEGGSGEGDGKGSGEGEGETTGKKKNQTPGEGDGEHGDDCDCDECKAKKAKKNQTPGEGDGDGTGSGEGEGSGEDEGEGEKDPAAPSDKAKKAEGSGEGDDAGEGEKGSGEKEEGSGDGDDAGSGKGEGDGKGSGEGDGEVDDTWAADAYFAKK